MDDFQWDFVQGTVRHTEGNWSLYTTSFSQLPLYSYYNPLDPRSILQTETELEELIANEGPFDGVISHSGGAALAAEIIIRDALAHPFSLPDQRPFRFAIFINGASPLHAFRLEEANLSDETFDASSLINDAKSMFMRPSALRHKDGVSTEDQADHEAMLALLNTCEGRITCDGRAIISNGTHGLCRYDVRKGEEPLIDIPTLHIRSLEEDKHDPHHGLHLLGLCNPDNRKEFHHGYGHDFPRGRHEMKKISQLIRELAEEA